MALVPAICTQCGARIEVDNTNEAGICKHCGTAFITEKVILKFQGNVDVSGSTVKVDNTSEIDNMLQLARRARETGNHENAARYYEMVALKVPNNWEAYYFSISCKARCCIIRDIYNNIIALNNCLQPTYNLINQTETTVEAKACAVIDVAMDAAEVAELLIRGYDNHYNNIGSSIRYQYTDERNTIKNTGIVAERNIFKYIALVFGSDTAVMTKLLPLFKRIVSGVSDTELYNFCVNTIKRYDSSYSAPQMQSSSGCYVATCVYGSYDCPEVWTLRRFRDYTLDTTWYGRMFIKCYYAVSPTIVKWFGETKWFKTFWKARLDKMVSELNSKGVENTKYQDKY